MPGVKESIMPASCLRALFLQRDDETFLKSEHNKHDLFHAPDTDNPNTKKTKGVRFHSASNRRFSSSTLEHHSSKSSSSSPSACVGIKTEMPAAAAARTAAASEAAAAAAEVGGT